MAKTSEQTLTCASCGAVIYKEHIDAGIARYEDDKLLCAHCVAEYERSHDATLGGGGPKIASLKLDFDEEEEAQTPESAKSKIQLSSAKTLSESDAWDEGKFKRSLQSEGDGATRVRIFHAKLSEGAIDFMLGNMNDWLDSNERIKIKFATSSIGPFEGKHTEPNLILTLFY